MNIMAALSSKSNKRWRAALLACGLLSACGRAYRDGENPFGDAAGSAGSAGSAQSAPGGSSAGGDSSFAGSDGDGDPCIPEIPVTSQIPRLLNRQYANVMRDLLGITTLPNGSAGDSRVSNLLFEDFDGPMNSPAWKVYMDVGEKIAQAVMTGANRSKFISCEPAKAGCLEDTTKNFGRRAFRRPLTDAELARFQKLRQAMPEATPDELAETTLYAFLISPSFLLLPELLPDPKGSKANIELSSHEVATRLSMLLWASIPDDELDAAADANLLRSKEQILAQARRMVAVRDKVVPVLTAFHHYWSQMDNPSGHWWIGKHDTAKFPLYTADVETALQAEMDAFFEDIAYGHGTYKDYFLSKVAFVTRDTAPIYGLDPARYGKDLKRVELDAQQRSGFLTRAGFLSSYANYGSSNPFFRGNYIAASLLGLQLGQSDSHPTVDYSPEVAASFKTNREFSEALTSTAPCKACHAIINPWGYALENYDAIGKWQTVDQRSGQIDASATVDLGDGQPKQIDNPLQLMQELADAPQVRRGYAKSWVSFAFNRDASKGDMCTVDQLDSKLAIDGYTVLSVLPDLSQADAFRLRTQGTP
ncbi:MAG TPA: DUF1592 domain-containing protein [Polyangiaceae bacterium]|nr:DUF1592 domain-containing protein [Polyangiaceae bacterium]